VNTGTSMGLISGTVPVVAVTVTVITRMALAGVG